MAKWLAFNQVDEYDVIVPADRILLVEDFDDYRRIFLSGGGPRQWVDVNDEFYDILETLEASSNGT